MEGGITINCLQVEQAILSNMGEPQLRPEGQKLKFPGEGILLKTAA